MKINYYALAFGLATASIPNIASASMDGLGLSANVYQRQESPIQQQIQPSQKSLSGFTLQPLPSAPLKSGLTADAPGNVFNPKLQLELLAGHGLAAQHFTEPQSSVTVVAQATLPPPPPAPAPAPVPADEKPLPTPKPPAPPPTQSTQAEVATLVSSVFRKVEEPPPSPTSSPAQQAHRYVPRAGTAFTAERVQVDPEGAAAIKNVAAHLGLDPVEFAALMSWESAGTLNPNVTGGDKTYGGRYYPEGAYKGMIQFNPTWQKHYGVGGQQSIAEHMPAVKQYLLDNGFRPGEHDIRHAYSAILAGEADERYWNRKDSNGTNVWNAAPKFQRGPHYERARAFLQASEQAQTQVQQSQQLLQPTPELKPYFEKQKSNELDSLLSLHAPALYRG